MVNRAAIALALLATVIVHAQNRDRRIQPIVARKQVALVIGNAAYGNRPLLNPVNDARAMARVLQSLNYDVALITDADRKAMGQAIDRFVAKLGTGDVAFFYYSGHGMQVEDENYLLPVDFQGKDEKDARYDAEPASRIQDRMERSGAQLNIMVLDACRDNPFHSSSRSSAGGLAAMSGGRGTFIAFATSPGKTASDNPGGKNGLFTQYLLEALPEPGLGLNEVFDLVRERVDAASNGKQLPWTLSSVVGRYSFVAGSATPAANGGRATPDVNPPTPRADPNPPASVDTNPKEAPPGEQRRLTPDLLVYCRSHGYSGLRNLNDTGFGWRCTPGDVVINTNQACKEQYGAPFVAHLISPPPGRPSDWVCINNSVPQSTPAKNGGRAATDLNPSAPRVDAKPPSNLKVDSKVNPKDGLTYVSIPPGTFMMGCSPDDMQCPPDEKPPRKLTITNGFWMGQTDVTQEAYQRVVGKNPSRFKGPKLPVEQVGLDDARAYCATVGMRIPTEAEWEYAARAGTTGSRYGDIDEISWHNRNSGAKTHEVGQKQPNAWNLCDMLGNVWQWTADWYAEQLPGGIDPTGPTAGQYRVVRGGSWVYAAPTIRVSQRSRIAYGVRNDNLGFRCVGN